MANLELLETVDIFSALTTSQVEQIQEISQEQVYYQGERIFDENSPSTEFYVILEGEVAIQVDPSIVTSSKADFLPGTIAVLRQGQTFGEVALVDEGLRSASAVCSSVSCKLLVIDRADLMTLLENDPLMGFRIMSNLAADLCFKIRQSNLQLRQALLYGQLDQEV